MSSSVFLRAEEAAEAQSWPQISQWVLILQLMLL